MPDNTAEESIDHIQNTVEQHINHIVRHDPETKGVIQIESNIDETYDIKIHSGTENKARVIEGVSKDKLLSMMEEQL
jgi:hypothetical protein